MKFNKSKLETIYLLSTNTKFYLAKTLPRSCRGVSELIFLYSLIKALLIGSFIDTLFFTNFNKRRPEVIIPITSPFDPLTGN